MNKRKYKIILGILVLILLAVNYSFMDGFLIKTFDEKENVFVERVIDGDTIVVNGTSFRLLGINTPERGEKYYSEAKIFLENKILNKTISVEKKGKDKYYRELAYVFYKNENVNLEIVRNGYANYYFPSGKDNYYSDFVSAWNECLISGKNLCEKSLNKCSGCIVVENFGYGKNLVLKNACGFDCDLNNWEVKDEGRKKYVFENFVLKKYEKIELTSEDFGNDYVWTKTGDTIFLRDSDGKLVLWEGY